MRYESYPTILLFCAKCSLMQAPDTVKTVQRGGVASVKFGSASMQGWPGAMLHRVSVVEHVPGHPQWLAAVVCDARGGAAVAEYCAAHLIPALARRVPSPGASTTRHCTI